MPKTTRILIVPLVIAAGSTFLRADDRASTSDPVVAPIAATPIPDGHRADGAAVHASAPGSVEALVAQARVHLQQNEPKEAIELLERALVLEPDNSRLHSDLGSALGQRIGQVNFINRGVIAAKMRAAYEAAVELDPNNLNGWIGLCRYHLYAPAIAGGGLEKAESYAREVQKRDGFLGAMELASVFTTGKRKEEALAQYRTAAQLRPDHPEAIMGLGRALAEAGDVSGARVAFRRVLEIRPNHESAAKALDELNRVRP